MRLLDVLPDVPTLLAHDDSRSRGRVFIFDDIDEAFLLIRLVACGVLSGFLGVPQGLLDQSSV